MPLDHAKNEHVYVAYVLGTDNTGKTLSLPVTVCAGGSEGTIKCSDELGVYADDAKDIRGTLVIGKTSDKAFQMTSVTLNPSLFDTVRTAAPLTRNMVVTLEGMETPLSISGTDREAYYYFKVKMENDQSVRVDPTDQCARVDGVYMGVFEFHIQESNMPMPDIVFRSRPNTLHMKHMALVKFRSGESFACYAVPKRLPKARILSIRS